jgi:hypothetical protein
MGISGTVSGPWLWQQKTARGGFLLVLNYSGFFENCISPVLVDSFYGASRKGQSYELFDFRNVNFLFLEVHILANSSGRVELGSTSTV